MARLFHRDKSSRDAEHSHSATIRQGSNTRIGSAWMAVAIAVVVGVALIDFIVQNTRTVRIEFFWAQGKIPVAVALLAAAVGGALAVLIVGVARTTQLRLLRRRERQQAGNQETGQQQVGTDPQQPALRSENPLSP